MEEEQKKGRKEGGKKEGGRGKDRERGREGEASLDGSNNKIYCK